MSYKLPLALIALAVIMLVGCKQPVGLPNNDVHAASTTVYCYLVDPDDAKWSGHLDLYAGYMTPDSAIDSVSPTIRRGYYEYQNRPYPRQIGFAVFEVPEFDASGGVPDCTLYYYQSAHSGYPDLEVRDMGITTAPSTAHDMFWGAWDSDVIIAEDSTHQASGWYKVALTSEGVDMIVELSSGGGTIWAGWVYDGTTNGIYTEVDGATSDNPPYIKVVAQQRTELSASPQHGRSHTRRPPVGSQPGTVPEADSGGAELAIA